VKSQHTTHKALHVQQVSIVRKRRSFVIYLSIIKPWLRFSVLGSTFDFRPFVFSSISVARTSNSNKPYCSSWTRHIILVPPDQPHLSSFIFFLFSFEKKTRDNNIYIYIYIHTHPYKHYPTKQPLDDDV
jgi:hypothetical protein